MVAKKHDFAARQKALDAHTGVGENLAIGKVPGADADHGNRGFDSAEIGARGGRMGTMVDVEGAKTASRYQPSKVTPRGKDGVLGNTKDQDYNHKSKGRFEGKQGERNPEGSSERKIKTDVGGIMGNTPNVPREPNKGKEKITGYEDKDGHVGRGLTNARKGETERGESADKKMLGSHRDVRVGEAGGGRAGAHSGGKSVKGFDDAGTHDGFVK